MLGHPFSVMAEHPGDLKLVDCVFAENENLPTIYAQSPQSSDQVFNRKLDKALTVSSGITNNKNKDQSDISEIDALVTLWNDWQQRRLGQSTNDTSRLHITLRECIFIVR
jgi:hypothetical protein